MIFNWFNASEAAKIGVALADQFAPPQAVGTGALDKQSARSGPDGALEQVLQRADREVGGMRLNFYKKAKLANSFKWRLLESGVERAVADEVTQRLVLHLSGNQAVSELRPDSDVGPADQPRRSDAKYLLSQGDKSMARGAYS